MPKRSSNVSGRNTPVLRPVQWRVRLMERHCFGRSSWPSDVQPCGTPLGYLILLACLWVSTPLPTFQVKYGTQLHRTYPSLSGSLCNPILSSFRRPRRDRRHRVSLHRTLLVRPPPAPFDSLVLTPPRPLRSKAARHPPRLPGSDGVPIASSPLPRHTVRPADRSH